MNGTYKAIDWDSGINQPVGVDTIDTDIGSDIDFGAMQKQFGISEEAFKALPADKQMDVMNKFNASQDSGFGFNTGTLGAVAGLGNLALGYANYRDAKKTNELAREGAQFNLSQARKDAAATDKYRASYGV